LLIVIATMSVALAATGTLWHEAQQRDKEQDLIFVGLQYRRAIRQYYETSPGAKVYPQSIERLLLDARMPGVRRYLRRPYRDPVANTENWGLMQAPQGGIMGVYSLAEGSPLKQAGFPGELAWPDDAPEDRSSYAGWKFSYAPPQAPAAPPRQ